MSILTWKRERNITLPTDSPSGYERRLYRALRHDVLLHYGIWWEDKSTLKDREGTTFSLLENSGMCAAYFAPARMSGAVGGSSDGRACHECPLFRVVGTGCLNDGSPFMQFLETHDPEIMLEVLP